jgi:hypothetical protein
MALLMRTSFAIMISLLLVPIAEPCSYFASPHTAHGQEISDRCSEIGIAGMAGVVFSSWQEDPVGHFNCCEYRGANAGT